MRYSSQQSIKMVTEFDGAICGECGNKDLSVRHNQPTDDGTCDVYECCCGNRWEVAWRVIYSMATLTRKEDK